MDKAQIVAHARTIVHDYVAGAAKAGKPLNTAFDQLSVMAHLVEMSPVDIWILGGLVTIQQLEQWIIEAIPCYLFPFYHRDQGSNSRVWLEKILWRNQ